MEITTEERLRIIAAYLPCQLYDIRNKTRVDAYGIYFKSRTVHFESLQTGDVYFDDVDNFQLVLKPLAQITDEEIHAAYHAVGIGSYIKDWSKHTFLQVFHASKIADEELRFSQSIYYIMIDHLRRLGFDMGFMRFSSLISANIAIAE